MHPPEAIHVSLYMSALMAAIGIAIGQVATQRGGTAWWGMLVAAGAPRTVGIRRRAGPRGI